MLLGGSSVLVIVSLLTSMRNLKSSPNPKFHRVTEAISHQNLIAIRKHNWENKILYLCSKRLQNTSPVLLNTSNLSIFGSIYKYSESEVNRHILCRKLY